MIGRGWTYYAERPWLVGLFYWTGFDYRGESNPLVFPATGSSFGILDYCGFPKDEAWYLRAWWFVRSAWQAPERPMDPDARTFSMASFNGLAQVLL